MPGIHLELASNPRVSETFELFVNAVDRGAAGMRLECQYNSDLFDAATIERLMDHYRCLLEAMVAELPKKDEPAMPGGGGMGGMGGMDGMM